MIRVERGAAPPGFAERSAAWAERYEQAKLAQPELTPSKFWGKVRHEIKEAGDAAALARVFRGKCAYCEARMAHVTHPHIEHYRPKSKFVKRMFDWENWLLSCGRCNDEKWSDFPYCGGSPCLIDPCSENPSPHLHFKREQALPTTYRGLVTVRMLGLNRTPLDEERSQHLLLLDSLFNLILFADEATKAVARKGLIWSMQSDAPYARMSYCYLKKYAPRLADPAAPHPRVELEELIDQLSTLNALNQGVLGNLS